MDVTMTNVLSVMTTTAVALLLVTASSALSSNSNVGSRQRRSLMLGGPFVLPLLIPRQVEAMPMVTTDELKVILRDSASRDQCNQGL